MSFTRGREPRAGTARGCGSPPRSPGGRRSPAGCPAARPRGGRRRTRGPRRRRRARRSTGARMNTARTGGPSIPGIRRSASKERIWRPKALRSQRQSAIPRWSRSSMIIPAHVPRIGRPNRRAAARRGPRARCRASSSSTRRRGSRGRRGPPGPCGVRTSPASAPSSRSMRTCAAKSPCRASTPTRIGTTSPGWRAADPLELARLERDHRHAEALGGAGDAHRVLEVGRRLDDRGGTGGRDRRT